ncbi:MAG: PKD domain-containing protein [Bacteroidetes bacterium]|nr:PKD domain-containing protein [Bacteroidota bacterium]MBK9541856.1 PKD domain-containing protein [Bacteroidota bacterium]MBP6647932.1 PKD domain-containing protein [Bacteroidia bacterium]
MMKTTQRLTILLLFVFALFYSCKKEDDPTPSNASFTANKTQVVVNEEIQFTNQSANATAFKWSFGDGTTSTEFSPKKTFLSSAVFTVNLVSTGSGGSASSSMQITVLPSCSFVVQREDSLSAAVPVQFTNTSLGADSYEWSFGDTGNSTSTDTNATFTYTAGGTYTVTLKARGAAGETSISKQITVAGVQVVRQLYFIEYGNNLIQKLPLDGTGVPSSFLDITGKAGVGLAYDAVHQKIYFSDFEIATLGNIWSVNLDGSDLRAIASNISDPYGIALDVAGGKIYWTDDAGNISRANLDGSSPQIGIVNIASGQMRAIALDPAHNKMYFYEVNAENLYMANMDGTGATIILTGVYGYAIAVDNLNSRIYFDEQNSGSLMSTDLNGAGSITVAASTTRIYGLLVDPSDGKIYWSGRDSGELKRANTDGSNTEILQSGLLSPRGIFIN